MARDHDTIICVLVPRFALRVAAADDFRLPDAPLALGPEPGGPPAIGEANAAAAAHGVTPGMRVGEAIARCPLLQLITPDPGTVAAADERFLDRLEQLGAAVEPLAPGAALFAADGLVRLHRGTLRLLQAVAGVLPAGGRVGAGPGRFIARAAAGKARPHRPFAVESGMGASFLAPLALSQLRLDPKLEAQLSALGIITIGDLAGLPLPAVADRFGRPGIEAWRLSRGEDEAHIIPRTPPEPLSEAIEFPEPVGDELTLRGAVVVLVDRLLAHPNRRGRPARSVTISARLAAGGSWRRPIALRDATADPRRLRDAISPRLTELPAAVIQLELELSALAQSGDRQLALIRPPEELLFERASEAARQVRAGVGDGSLWRVVEVAPMSRIPEGRDLMVPFEG
jgi:protein ImuB